MVAAGLPGPPPGPAPRRAIATALLCGSAFAATLGVVPPLLPVMRDAFALSDVGAAWIVSAFAVARLAIDLPAGIVLERIGRRRAFVAGGLLVAAGGLLSAAAATPWALYLARALGGVGHGLTNLTLLLFVLGASPASVRSRAGSLSEFTVVGTFLLVSLLAGPVSAAVGWRGSLVLVGVLSAAATWAGGRLPWAATAGPAPGEGGGRPPGPAGPGTSVLPVAAAAFSLSLTWSGVLLTLVPLAAASRLGLDATAIGRVLAVNYAADLLLLLPVATLADRTGRGSWILAGMLGLSAVASPAALLAPSPAFLAAAVLVAGTTFSAWMIPATLLLRAVASAKHARTLGLFRFTGDVAAVLGPLAMAAVYEAGGARAAAVLAAAVPLAAAAAMARAARSGG